MGLFDDISLAPEIVLPDGFDGRWFQTKDFPDPYMDKYRITAAGTLERFDFDAELTGRMIFDEFLKGEYPEQRRVNERWTPLDHHGWLNFYTNEPVWHEYNAKFTDGALVEIRAVPTVTTSAADEDSAERDAAQDKLSAMPARSEAEPH